MRAQNSGERNRLAKCPATQSEESCDGERSPESQPFTIKLDEDRPPQLQIRLPEPDDIQLPANGLLSVDGGAGDDYGLDKMTLKLKLADTAARPLADQPYNGGKSFRREKDNTWPTDLDFKLSADLAKLTHKDGRKVEPKFDPEKPVLIEYWVEAIDTVVLLSSAAIPRSRLRHPEPSGARTLHTGGAPG